MPTCYLGLGSNLKSPKRQLQIAISNLRKIKQSSIIKISTPYFNKPVGIRSQPMFYNIVVAMNTSLSPHNLLKHCREIEQQQGRIRKQINGARTIDIDILLFGNNKIKTFDLIVPHPHMLERDFVLIPLLEISPDISLY